jgi:hypothetical protein
VPDDDQEHASNGNDSLVRFLAGDQALELGLPEGVVTDGDPGGLDEDGAQFAATLFGNAAGVMRFTGGVDASAEASVIDELFGGREAGNIANRGHAAQRS